MQLNHSISLFIKSCVGSEQRLFGDSSEVDEYLEQEPIASKACSWIFLALKPTTSMILVKSLQIYPIHLTISLFSIYNYKKDYVFQTNIKISTNLAFDQVNNNKVLLKGIGIT